MKQLVAYFSASGITKAVAEKLARIKKADLFEIIPQEMYTSDDLDWTNANSRSSIEMKDKSSRPKIISKVKNINEYDVIYLGFPGQARSCRSFAAGCCPRRRCVGPG